MATQPVMLGNRTIRTLVTVLPGGRVEVRDTALMPGEWVEVEIRPHAMPGPDQASVLDILAEAPGHRAFRTAEEVDAYLQSERDAWER